jgi:hypothetical protein
MGAAEHCMRRCCLCADRQRLDDDSDNPLLAAYDEKALIGWLRSHPDVARRWWSDVLATRPGLTQPPAQP